MLNQQVDSNYDAILTDLLSQLFEREEWGFLERLGVSQTEDGVIRVPFFGQECLVRPDAVQVNGSHLPAIASIVVVRYLMQAGEDPIFNIWVPFRDLKDGAHIGTYVQSKIEERIARHCAGKKGQLEERLRSLGGNVYRTGTNPELAVALIAFPRLHLLTLFWDADKESTGSFQFLFDKSARSYLDIESLVGLLEYICLKIEE